MTRPNWGALVEALTRIEPGIKNLSLVEQTELYAAMVGAVRRGLAAHGLDEGRTAVALTPPAWIVRGPDMEGTWSGPSFSCAALGAVIHTSWSPWEGARMRLDLSSDEANAELEPSQARDFSGALLSAASLVEGANR